MPVPWGRTDSVQKIVKNAVRVFGDLLLSLRGKYANSEPLGPAAIAVAAVATVVAAVAAPVASVTAPVAAVAAPVAPASWLRHRVENIVMSRPREVIHTPGMTAPGIAHFCRKKKISRRGGGEIGREGRERERERASEETGEREMERGSESK